MKNQERAEELKLLPLQYRSDTLVTFSEVSVCYEKNPVSCPVSFSIRRGERVVLEGSNGSGKSSLLKFVVGEALEKLKKRYPDAAIRVKIPEEFLMIPMDAVLIEQVTINLLEKCHRSFRKYPAH